MEVFRPMTRIRSIICMIAFMYAGTIYKQLKTISMDFGFYIFWIYNSIFYLINQV